MNDTLYHVISLSRLQTVECESIFFLRYPSGTLIIAIENGNL